MKFTLTIRPLTDSDVSADCPFGPEVEDEDIDLYLSSLVEDIEKLSAVKSVTRDGCVFTIEVSDGTTHQELKAAMMPFFSDQFCKFRFVSLT